MFTLTVLLTRYIFLFYIITFFFVNEKKQKILILLFHLTAFTILIYDSRSISVMLTGVASFIVLIAADIAVKRMYAIHNSFGKLVPAGNESLWNDTAFLMVIGIVTLTRLAINESVYDSLAVKQILWFFVAVVVMLFIPTILKVVRHFEKLTYLYIVAAIALIASTLVLGQEQYGAVNWINIGGFSFQPSEFVKVLFVFYLASMLGKKITTEKIITSGILSAVIVLLLVYARDLGGALIFFVTYMIVLYAATGNILLFGAGMSAAVAASFVAFNNFSHIRVRVNAWLNPWQYIDTDGYQIALGFFSMGTYGILGSGLTLGQPNFNSVVERDMIFVAICEEFGTIFGGVLIILYMHLFYRAIQIALSTPSKSHALLATGITTMLAFQTFLILGGILTVIPLTGVTLPLISYGGSSVLVTVAMLGILQWLHMHTREGEIY